jgi:glycosyltransferase involved in cell wall biosynthesis
MPSVARIHLRSGSIYLNEAKFPILKNNITMFSVIIPTFNRCELLRQTLATVIQQTESSWEAIIIDNHSTDATEDVVESFRDPRLKLFKFRNEGIIAASRNYGISQAKGEYVAFLDSDDLWLPRKLESARASIEKGQSDLLSHSVMYFDGEHEIRTHVPPFESCEGIEAAKKILLKGNGLVTSSVIARTSLLRSAGGFCEDPKLTTAEDWDLWLRLTEAGGKLTIAQDKLAKYRCHPEGMSKHLRIRTDAANAVIDRHVTLRPDIYDPLKAEIKHCRAYIYFNAAKDALESGNRDELAYYLNKAISADSSFLNAWVLNVLTKISLGLSRCLMRSHLKLRGFRGN